MAITDPRWTALLSRIQKNEPTLATGLSKATQLFRTSRGVFILVFPQTEQNVARQIDTKDVVNRVVDYIRELGGEEVNLEIWVQL